MSFEEMNDVADVALEVAAEGDPKWLTWISISTMAMAVITAVGILLAGITLNEFFFERTQELVELSRLGVDRVNMEVLESKHHILTVLGEPLDSAEVQKLEDYRQEALVLAPLVAEEDELSRRALFEHELFAIGVTLLSIAITITAVSAILKKKSMWFSGLAVGALGAGFVLFATVAMIS